MTLDLNPRQAAFVDAYTAGPTMGVASASAVAAGFSAESAPDLMSMPAIVKRLDDLSATAAAQSGIGKARTMAELGRIAFADLRAIVQWRTVVIETGDLDADGVPITRQEVQMSLTDWAVMNPSAAAALAEIRQTKDGLVVKMHSKVAALVELGRHLGVTTKIAHTGPDGIGPVQTITKDMSAVEAADLYRLTLDEG